MFAAQSDARTQAVRVQLVDPEISFEEALEEWYEAHGVSRNHPLFFPWVKAGGTNAHCAGLRIAREISARTSLEGKLVLDVGCGFGGAVTALSKMGASCVGIDIRDDELNLCGRRLALHGVDPSLLCADALRMPFSTETFDVVVCTDMLEHVKKRGALLTEIARVLKKGGLLYLAFPNLLGLRNVLRDPHYRLFGVVLMPLRVAQWYTRLRRGRNYDVEILPLFPRVARDCARLGIRVHCVNVGEDLLLAKIDSPQSITNRLTRKVAFTFEMLRLTWVLRLVVRLRAMTTPNVVLAGFKS